MRAEAQGTSSAATRDGSAIRGSVFGRILAATRVSSLSVNGSGAHSLGRARIGILALLATSFMLAFGASGAQALEVIDSFGTQSGSGSLGGELGGPQDIAVNSSGVGPANPGDLYVAESSNDRIQRFGRDDNGTPGNTVDDTYFFISAWGADVVSDGGTGDQGDSSDANFEVCVVASECQAGVGTGGNGTAAGNGALSLAGGIGSNSIAIDPDTGDVYVSDTGNNRVNVYTGDGQFLRSFGWDIQPPASPGNVANDEQQTVTLGGTTTGGKFALLFNGQTTGAAGRGLRNATVNPNVLTEVSTTNGAFAIGQVITGTGIPANTTITAVDTVNATLTLSANVTSGTGTSTTLTAHDIPWDASPAMVQSALESLPAIGAGNVSVTSGNPGGGVVGGPYTVRFQGALEGDVAQMTSSATGLVATSRSVAVATTVPGGSYEVCVAVNDDICQSGTSGAAAGQIASGRGIAVSTADANAATGTVFLADNSNRRVNTYRLDGSAPGSFGSSSNFGGSAPEHVAVDSRGIVYASDRNSTSQIDRYDSQNANGGGVGFLTSIAAPPLSTTNNQRKGFEVDPDSDGAGADTDVLYVLRDGGGGTTVVQQFGPVNRPGETAAPTAQDAQHGLVAGFRFVDGFGFDENDGRLFLAATSLDTDPGGKHRVYVLDTPNPAPVVTLDSISDITPSSAIAHATIDPNGAPDLRYRFEYSINGTTWTPIPIPDVVLGSQTNPQAIDQLIETPGIGLSPDTDYQVRLVAQRLYTPSTTTAPLAFRTLSAPPLVETNGPTYTTDTATQLNGRVNPRGVPTRFHFEYVDQVEFDANGFTNALRTPEGMGIGINETQRITVPGSSGQFRLSYDGETTVDLPFNATAAHVESALEDLSTIGAGNVTVSGINPFLVTFIGAFAARDALTIVASNGTTPLADPAGVTLTTAAQGSGSANERQQIVVNATAGQYRLRFGANTTANIAWNEFGPDFGFGDSVQGFLAALPSIGAGNVSVPDFSSPYTVEFVGALARTDVSQLDILPGTVPLTNVQSPPTVVTDIAGGPIDLQRLVAAQLRGLDPATIYRYRLVADNGNPGSPVFGEAMSVTTRAGEPPALSHGDFPGPIGSDRAWEQVSVPDSSGNPVQGAGSPSVDGNRVHYALAGGSHNTPFGGTIANIFAERTERGWQEGQIWPSRSELSVGTVFGFTNLVSPPDLSFTVIMDSDATNDAARFWRVSPTAPPQLLFGPVPFTGVVSQLIFINPGNPGRVIARLRGSFDPNFPAAASAFNFYDIATGSPRLVSVLPNGEATCDTGSNWFPPINHSASIGWLSDDGSFFYFEGKDTAACAGGGNFDLFLRDLDAGVTRKLSTAPVSGLDCDAGMIKAIPGEAFFWTKSRLVAEDTEPDNCAIDGSDGDVYRYDIGDDSLECVTCMVAGLDADVTIQAPPGGKLPASDAPSAIAIADDGSRIYFQTATRLLFGTLASRGLYRLDVDTGELRWIGPDMRVGSITADGSIFTFTSDHESRNPVGGKSNGGTSQVYRYNDEDGSIECISCPLEGDATDSASGGSDNQMTADGKTVVFRTAAPLVSSDQNAATGGQSSDVGVDLYEWRDGRHLLVTDGITERGPGKEPILGQITPGGGDVFFTLADQLTADALDGYRRLYTARIGGGIVFPEAPTPCPLEVCQGTPRGRPDLRGAATEGFQGAGNVKTTAQRRKPRRCGKGKRKVRRGGKVRCVKRKSARRANHDRRNAR